MTKKIDKIAKAYKEVFGTPSGRIVLHSILESCHFFKTTYVRGDSHTSSFFEGERNVALKIMAFLNIKYEDIRELAEEAKIINSSDQGDYNYDYRD